ncbi:hypothetical protein VNO77_41526 [Canavalia gladiata]|uniref:Uncharacterized protein n=1 Tax=Canavalia gladiata TaxID=3824 RepID=A0AAN9K032_CANGL
MFWLFVLFPPEKWFCLHFVSWKAVFFILTIKRIILAVKTDNFVLNSNLSKFTVYSMYAIVYEGFVLIKNNLLPNLLFVRFFPL